MFCKTLKYIDLFKPLHAENGIGNIVQQMSILKFPKPAELLSYTYCRSFHFAKTLEFYLVT
jgi:hypothetical protein